MKKLYTLDISTEEEAEYIDEMLTRYNLSCVPKAQEKAYIPIRFCVRDEAGGVVGGITAYSVLWKICYIDILWVREDWRGQGIGSVLLKEAEAKARSLGCHIAHLDTFDFQGKDFYLRHGYEVFGELADSPMGHTEYFLSKRLDNRAEQPPV